MTDQNEPMTPEQKQAAEFIEGLTDEQLEAMRRYYYNQLVAAADVAAITLGPTSVADCHIATGAEMLATAYGTRHAIEQLDAKIESLNAIDDYRSGNLQ